MFRKIYCVAAFSSEGELLMRRYAANMKTAKRIAKRYRDSVIRLTNKSEWDWINKNDVER